MTMPTTAISQLPDLLPSGASTSHFPLAGAGFTFALTGDSSADGREDHLAPTSEDQIEQGDFTPWTGVLPGQWPADTIRLPETERFAGEVLLVSQTQAGKTDRASAGTDPTLLADGDSLDGVTEPHRSGVDRTLGESRQQTDTPSLPLERRISRPPQPNAALPHNIHGPANANTASDPDAVAAQSAHSKADQLHAPTVFTQLHRKSSLALPETSDPANPPHESDEASDQHTPPARVTAPEIRLTTSENVGTQASAQILTHAFRTVFSTSGDDLSSETTVEVRDQLIAPAQLQPSSQAPLASTPQGSARSAVAHAVVSQIAEAVLRERNGDIEVTLTPEDLGKLHLSIRATETGHVVNIWAERPETLEAARRSAEYLQRELRDNGFGEATLSFSGDGDTAKQQASAKVSGTHANAPASHQDLELQAPERATILPGALNMKV